MTTKETLNAIDTKIATLVLNTEKVRKFSYDRQEITDCMVKEIAYQECRNIILKVMEESGC